VQGIQGDTAKESGLSGKVLFRLKFGKIKFYVSGKSFVNLRTAIMRNMVNENTVGFLGVFGGCVPETL
jgi:hypothetical protein